MTAPAGGAHARRAARASRARASAARRSSRRTRGAAGAGSPTCSRRARGAGDSGAARSRVGSGAGGVAAAGCTRGPGRTASAPTGARRAGRARRARATARTCRDSQRCESQGHEPESQATNRAFVVPHAQVRHITSTVARDGGCSRETAVRGGRGRYLQANFLRPARKWASIVSPWSTRRRARPPASPSRPSS